MSLVRVPSHRLMESPASWLTRVALSQFTTTKELRSLCKLGITNDPDMWCVTRPFEDVAATLGAEQGSFSLVNRVLNHLHQIDPSGSRFLLGPHQAPRYRFCPVCLLEDEVKYFRIEWRFLCWLWCPLHMCRLLDACPACAKPVQLPADLISAGPEGWGVATLDRCLSCESDLTAEAHSHTDTLDFSDLTEWERCLLKNGRAVLAALLKGRFVVRGEYMVARKHVKELGSLDKQGLIPLFANIPYWVRRPEADCRMDLAASPGAINGGSHDNAK